MAVYDGFFDAALDDETEEYDRAYESGDFTGYFEKIIGSGVCVHGNENSFKVRLENGKAVVSPGYLFIQGYWCKNDADYPIGLPGASSYAIVAHLNLGQRMIELGAHSVAQAYPDSLVLAIVSPSSAEDTRHNTNICGVIDTAGALSSKVEWALNYIDTEIESKLAQMEQDIAAQSAKLDLKIAEVQAVADSIVPPPIGSIKFSASQNVGSEWLKCDGSFVNEAQYPELVESLGKLIPSGDKFQLISSGEIGPQISNGVIYGGKMWVYSYSTKKLYGVDLARTAEVKEITVTSEEPTFSDFLAPTIERPIALSIVPSAVGAGASVFLCQIIKDETINSISVDAENKMSYQLVFCADFFEDVQIISFHLAFNSITARRVYYVQSKSVVPYVTSSSKDGVETFYCAIYCESYSFYLSWDATNKVANVEWNTEGQGYYSTIQGAQRASFNNKSQGEMVFFTHSAVYGGGYYTYVRSVPNGTYSTSGAQVRSTNGVITVPLPLNVVGRDKLLFEFSKTGVSSMGITEATPWEFQATGLTPPSAARTFPDAAAYLWGKDIYLIFVGTGIIFSRTLEANSFGYLDTTSVLGTITQFGYLDYSQDEGTLYLLGQDTTNTVKVAKIVLNTLYDYANDGAWLPMIASDGVPAYIKAKEAET